MKGLADIELVKWGEIAEQFQSFFPDIAVHLDRLLKKNTACFYRARYPFGAEIVTQGKLQVPYQGRLTSIDSEELPTTLFEHLNYTTTALPVCAVVKGFVESHINLPSHLIPLRILKPGTLFALNNIFQLERSSHIVDRAYTYTSGARSLLILPKVSHEQYNERLARAYTIDPAVLCPKTFFDQWSLFKELVNAPEFQTDWESEIIIFTKEVFDLIQEDVGIKFAFLSRLWTHSIFSQNQVMYDLVWSIFAENLKNSLKNTPFVIETVKHIIKLAMSETPGYIPACSDVQGPVQGLMDIFLNVYRIRYYLPIFMELSYYNKHDPIYYSLQKHTFLCHIPQKANANRTIDELLAIKELLESFKTQVLENAFPISLGNTILYKTLEEVEFEFFHPQGGDGLNSDVDMIVADDPRFMHPFSASNIDKDLVFPRHSLFFNGCIRIRPPKKEAPKPLMKEFLKAPGGHFRLDEDK